MVIKYGTKHDSIVSTNTRPSTCTLTLEAHGTEAEMDWLKEQIDKIGTTERDRRKKCQA